MSTDEAAASNSTHPSEPPAAVPADRVSRRALLLSAGVVAAGLGATELIGRLATVPERAAAAAAERQSDIQFDIDGFIRPAELMDGIEVRFPPVHTVFATARLMWRPTTRDQRELEAALDTLEDRYRWDPAGLFTHVSYGLPYFARLPGSLVRDAVPRLLSNGRRSALEEAVPAPTDVHDDNPGIAKRRFQVPVRIERNDLLFTFRTDVASHATDAIRWLAGSNSLAGRSVRSPRLGALLSFTSVRSMFVQRGLPRRIADRQGMPFAAMIHPETPMWMGFVDQQTEGSAAARTVTFRGGDGVRLTDARRGDYFDNGAIQHLSHVILDLQQFYDVDDDGVPGDDATYLERVQYMFRSTPPPHEGYADQYTDGGGPAVLSVPFQGFDDAERSAQGIGTPENERRIGHVSTLQRSSRTIDGRPIHVRVDGPGFDPMDVPGGSSQPKLQFSVFVPTADLFETMRRHQASLDLVEEHDIEEDENGLERFLTATRRQNYLMPPRRHRAFPLTEHI